MTHCKNTIAILFVCACFVLAAPAQNTQWTRQFGSSSTDTARGVAASPFGVYVVGGVNGDLPGQSSFGNGDAYLRKYDVNGNEAWTRIIGTTQFEQAQAVAADNSGVYVVGTTEGTIPGETNIGQADVFIRKYDHDGNVIWTRQFGTSSGDQGQGVAVDATGVYVTGSVVGALPSQVAVGSNDVFLRKYTLSGNELWTRQFGTASSDRPRDVIVDSETVYVAGAVGAGVLPGQSSAGSNDAFVRKYDALGSEQWTRQFGSAGNDEGTGLAVNSSGIYVTGWVEVALPGQTNSGSFDNFLRKYDADGTEQWTRQFGSPASDNPFGAAADPTGVYVVGAVDAALPGQSHVGSSDAFVRKYDVNGNERWTRQFGSGLLDRAWAADSDSSGLYIAGESDSVLEGQASAGGRDAYAAKISPGGPPFLPFNAVVGGASYVPSVTAGSIASAFGFSLSPENAGGLQVRANAIVAPVYAVTTGQINFQVPWELSGSSQNFLVVTVDGNTTSPVSIPVSTFAPGIFSTNASGSGQGAILIANTAFVAAPAGMFPGSRPVNRGESISIFVTGLGAVTNQPPTGVAASGSSTTITQPTVTIGGVAAPVSFSGLAPGFFGLYQVNVQVPQGASVGSAINVVLSIGGVASNAVTIAVSGGVSGAGDWDY